MKTFFLSLIAILIASSVFAQQQVPFVQSGAWEMLKPAFTIPPRQNYDDIQGLITECPVTVHQDGSISIKDQVNAVVKFYHVVNVQKEDGSRGQMQIIHPPEICFPHLSNNYGNAYQYFIASQRSNLIPIPADNGDITYAYRSPVLIHLYHEYKPTNDPPRTPRDNSRFWYTF